MTVTEAVAAPRVRRPITRVQVHAARLAIVVGVLAAWEFLPKIAFLQDLSPVFDPFFVSSPTMVVSRLNELATGANASETMWSYLLETLKGTFIGVSIGTVTGAAAGLAFSQSATLAKILWPFVVMLNATPRIALIPIFVIIAGPTLTSTVLTSLLVVFFLVFYNAFSGAKASRRRSSTTHS